MAAAPLRQLPGLLVLLTLTSTSAATTADRCDYPGSEALNDEDLLAFVEGYAWPPGRRLPTYAGRFLKMHRESESPGSGQLTLPNQLGAGPNTVVSQDTSNEFGEPAISIDRTNPLRVVAAANAEKPPYFAIFSSADSGKTWSTVPMPIDWSLFCCDPTIAWDSQGVVYVTGVSNAVVRSADGGLTWTAIPAPPPPDPVHTYGDLPRMAISDAKGSACQDMVCIGYGEIVDSIVAASISCSLRAEGPWIKNTLASGLKVAPALFPAFGSDGELHVAWFDNDASRIYVSRSDDCGATFSPPVPLGPAPTCAGLLCPFTYKWDGGSRVYPVLDVDRSKGPLRGTVYAVWPSNEGGPGCTATCSPNWPSPGCNCFSNVYLARSIDGGQTWTSAVVVHEDVPDTFQVNPWLAVDDSDGSLTVMWLDTRHGPGPFRGVWDTYTRSSRDGALTWEPEQRITSDSTFAGGGLGDYGGLSTYNCLVLPVWTDRRVPLTKGQTFTADANAGVLGNTLFIVRDKLGFPLLSWSDLQGQEVDYRVLRREQKDVPPSEIGTSGSPDAVTFTDLLVPSGMPALYYSVEAINICGN